MGHEPGTRWELIGRAGDDDREGASIETRCELVEPPTMEQTNAWMESTAAAFKHAFGRECAQKGAAVLPYWPDAE